MKPQIHQSRLKHYLVCPKAYDLSGKHEAEIGSSTLNAMREGELFEGYVFGFKPEKDEKEIIGRKKPETIQLIKTHADYAKQIFVSGEPYVKLKHEKADFVMAGEADHIGKLNWDWIKSELGFAMTPDEETINDLKYTGDIPRVWDNKNRADYLQSIYYIAIHFFNTGKLLPFVYIVVEGQYSKPLIRLVKIVVNESDINNWLMPIVESAATDLFYDAIPGEPCSGGKYGSRCWYLQHCKEGKRHVGGANVIEWGLSFG